MTAPLVRPWRRLIIAGLVLSALIAGVFSSLASEHPDGLEFVADKHGFMDTATQSPVAGLPFADYGIAGIDNAWLSGGLAGLLGIAITGVLAMVVIAVVRRQPRPGVTVPRT